MNRIIIKKSLETYREINEIQLQNDLSSESNKMLEAIGCNNGWDDGCNPDSYTDEIEAICDFFDRKDYNCSDYPTLVSYLTALHPYVHKLNSYCRIKVSGKEINKEKLETLCSIVFDPENISNAKWPSSFSLSFMQQLAVNIEHNQDIFSKDISGSDNKTVFSVNGPPGTGKTTLLKEIISDYIVKRAKELSLHGINYFFDEQAIFYRKPFYGIKRFYDEITKTSNDEECWQKWCTYYNIFKPNEELLKYGITVVSNNNKAVENVSLDFPCDKDLEAKLKEYRRLFNSSFDFFQPIVEEYYRIRGIKAPNRPWGLISVPLGKNENIYFAYKYLVIPILKTMSKVSVEDAENRFLKQYSKVEDMKKELKVIKDEFEALEKEIIEIYGKCEKHPFDFIDDLNKKIEEKKELITGINLEIQSLEEEFVEIRNANSVDWFTALFSPSEFKRREKRIEEQLNKIKNQEKIKQSYIDDINKIKNLIDKIKVVIDHSKKHPDRYWNEKEKENDESMVYLSPRFFKDLGNIGNASDYRKAQIETPWITKSLNREREFLFFAALEYYYHCVFSSEEMREILFSYVRLPLLSPEEYNDLKYTLEYKVVLPKGRKNSICLKLDEPISEVIPPLSYDGNNIKYIVRKALHIFFPVVSSTFASIKSYPFHSTNTYDENYLKEMIIFFHSQKNFFCEGLYKKYLEENEVLRNRHYIENSYLDIFGTLIVDEAGQAMPHQALGALIRAKRAVIVGDPLQIPPVAINEEKMKTAAFQSENNYKNYFDLENSVQTVADSINPFGGYLNSFDKDLNPMWVGCPLTVHRRCIEPMFSISNQLCYDSVMVNATLGPREEVFFLKKSCWINTEGDVLIQRDRKSHYNEEQFNKLLEILKSRNIKNSSVFVITPFKQVENMIIKNLNLHGGFDLNFCKDIVGTVHKFQGREAKEVFFVLGCGNSTREGTYKWVSKKIINVAVTRAKYRLYIIGNREKWTAYNMSMKTVSGQLP